MNLYVFALWCGVLCCPHNCDDGGAGCDVRKKQGRQHISLYPHSISLYIYTTYLLTYIEVDLVYALFHCRHSAYTKNVLVLNQDSDYLHQRWF